MISSFRGRWAKLGNYSICTIFYQGHMYQSVEHAYQAARFSHAALKKIVRDEPSPNQAKQRAHAMIAATREDWDNVKVDIMHELLREKFSQEPERSVLLSTGNEELVEGNWWKDTFWGQCPVGNGQNWLGRLLMDVRQELHDGTLIPPSEGEWKLT